MYNWNKPHTVSLTRQVSATLVGRKAESLKHPLSAVLHPERNVQKSVPLPDLRKDRQYLPFFSLNRSVWPPGSKRISEMLITINLNRCWLLQMWQLSWRKLEQLTAFRVQRLMWKLCSLYRDFQGPPETICFHWQGYTFSTGTVHLQILPEGRNVNGLDIPQKSYWSTILQALCRLDLMPTK